MYMPSGADTSPTVLTAKDGVVQPGGQTSILYKFGMSPKIWALVGLGIAGAAYYIKKRK